MTDKERATRMKRSPVRRIKSAMKRTLILLLLSSAPAWAGDYAADFLRIGVGARAMAMGGAYTGVANDASATYWNPAGWAGNYRMAVQLEHVPIFSGLAQYNSISAHLAFDYSTSISVNWIRLGVDDIPRYGSLDGSRYDRLILGQHRSSGEPLGYFSDKEDAFMVTFRRSVILDLEMAGGVTDTYFPTEISVGVTGKYIHQKIDTYAGSGQGLDAGILIRVMPNWEDEPEPVTWFGGGAVLRDLARTQLSWNTDSRHKDEIGRGLVTGVAASHLFRNWRTRVTLSYDRALWQDEGNHAGCEVEFLRTISLRGGYQQDFFTAGAGLHLGGFTIDYAFVAGELDNTHRISGAFGF